MQTFEKDESTQCKLSLAPDKMIESFKSKLNASEIQLNENYQMISADIMYWSDFTERVDTMLCYLDSKMELINEDSTLDVDQIAEKLKAREVRQLLLVRTLLKAERGMQWSFYLNHLSAKTTKWSNTLKQFVGNLPTNCLSMFDHFVGLVLKGLKKKLL